MPNEKFSRSFYAPQNPSIPTLHHPSHRLASRLILGQFWVYAYFMPVSIPQKNRRFSKKICTFAQKYPNMGNKENNTQPSDSKERKSALTVKDWALEDRPREKLIAKGKKELSNAELIAILIGSGSVGQSAVDLAKEILKSNDNDLSHLSRQGIKELTHDFKGMGEAKAVSIIAALELGYRMLSDNINKQEYYFKDSLSLFNYISPSLLDLPVEEFWAIYLNIKNKVLFKQRISLGGISNTPVDIRRIFATALEKNAVSIAVVHNHPSGILQPSREDKALTCRILDAGKLLNIKLIEHLIVGIDENNHPDYYSFHDNGLI